MKNLKSKLAADKRGRGVTRPRVSSPRRGCTPGPQRLNRATPVLSGIDTLYLHTHVNVAPEVAQRLALMKSQVEDGNVQDGVPFDLGGFHLMLRPRGTRAAKYLLDGEYFALKLNDAEDPRTKQGFPPVSIELRSLWLWKVGAVAAVAHLEQLLKPLLFLPSGVTSLNFQVSRLDITCDFQGWRPTQGMQFTARARGRATYESGSRLTGFTFGKSPRLGRLYDKTEEIKVKADKSWFEQIWKSCPDYVPSMPVWRLEFQFGRAPLHEHKPTLLSWRDACDHVRALWKYQTTNWLALRDTHKRTGRGELVRPWRDLRDNAFATGVWAGTDIDLYRVRRLRIARRHQGQLVGDVVRVMASAMYMKGATIETEAAVASDGTDATSPVAVTAEDATSIILGAVSGYCARTGKGLSQRTTKKLKEYVDAGLMGPIVHERDTTAVAPPSRDVAAGVASEIVAQPEPSVASPADTWARLFGADAVAPESVRDTVAHDLTDATPEERTETTGAPDTTNNDATLESVDAKVTR